MHIVQNLKEKFPSFPFYLSSSSQLQSERGFKSSNLTKGNLTMAKLNASFYSVTVIARERKRRYSNIQNITVLQDY